MKYKSADYIKFIQKFWLLKCVLANTMIPVKNMNHV